MFSTDYPHSVTLWPNSQRARAPSSPPGVDPAAIGQDARRATPRASTASDDRRWFIPLRDRAAIVGVGYTEFSQELGRAHADARAARDHRPRAPTPGSPSRDVDGVACHRVGDSRAGRGRRAVARHPRPPLLRRPVRRRQRVAYRRRVGRDGRGDRYGRLRRVLAVRSTPAASSAWAARVAPPPDAVEFQYQTPYGYATPPQQFAMYARAYMHELRRDRRGPRPGRDRAARVRARATSGR